MQLPKDSNAATVEESEPTGDSAPPAQQRISLATTWTLFFNPWLVPPPSSLAFTGEGVGGEILPKAEGELGN